MTIDLSAAREVFLQESRELLQQFETLMLAAEQTPPSHDDLNALFRAIHTIKGSAGIFGFDHLVEFSHGVENVLDDLRDARYSLSPELAGQLLQASDTIAAMIEEVASDDAPRQLAPFQIELLHKIGHWHGYAAEPAAKAKTAQGKLWSIRVKFGAGLLQDGIDPIACLQYLERLGDIEHLQTDATELPDLLQLDPERNYLGFDFLFRTDAPREDIEAAFEFAREGSSILIEEAQNTAAVAAQPAPVSPGKKPADGRFIRIEAAKLDTLINLVGELVIAGASANVLANARGDSAIQESIAAVSELVEQIRDSALNMRMVPVAEIFQRFPRLVRDLAQELGKEVELSITGEDTELDKSMVEKLADPLLHIVRNAIDHGLETPAARQAAGKTPVGHINLNAYHESGSVVIELNDDGAGISTDAVLAKGIERGLVAAGQNLTDDEILQLIFQPGFSTAQSITNISGRGVGMDVVKKNIEMLRGDIEIDNHPGQGLSMRLRLPLTMAIIDGFLIQIGNSPLVIPLDMVVECIELGDLESHYGHYIQLRGEVLPFIDLRDLFGINEAPTEKQNIVVVQYGSRRAGILVDRLHGELQVVIKPLGKLFRKIHGIGGSSILGSGEIALILDIPQIVQLAATRERKLIQNRSLQRHQGHRP